MRKPNQKKKYIKSVTYNIQGKLIAFSFKRKKKKKDGDINVAFRE